MRNLYDQCKSIDELNEEYDRMSERDDFDCNGKIRTDYEQRYRELYEIEEKNAKQYTQEMSVVDTISQMWIPIEEKEPPVGHIIVTVLWEKGVDTAYDDDYDVFEEDWYALNDSPMAQRIKARTIAWMPMPKPYKKQK